MAHFHYATLKWSVLGTTFSNISLENINMESHQWLSGTNHLELLAVVAR
jgi:hypothetical protein